MFFALLIEQFRYQFLTKLPSIGSLRVEAAGSPVSRFSELSQENITLSAIH